MDIPTFDPDALSRLTQKIETSFKNPPIKQAKSTRTKDQKIEKGQHSKPPRAESAKSKVGNVKKRLRNGDIKTASAPVPQRVPLNTVNNRTGQPDGDGKSKLTTGSREKSSLQEASAINQSVDEEVLALGGTQEDIELIEGVTSESEIEGTGTGAVEGLLLKDIQRFVQDLGIKGLVDVSSDTEAESGEPASLPVPKPTPKTQVIQQVSKQENGDTSKSRTGQTGSLKFQPVSEWHSVELPALLDSSTTSTLLPAEFLDRIHTYAKDLLAADNDAYSSQHGSSSSSHQFYSTIMSVGTLSDKISALTLSVQESPVHNMRALESLVTLAKKRSRSQAVEVLGALKDLFGPGSLLPSDRKLKTFGMQPALSAIFAKAHRTWRAGDSLPSPLTPAHLIYWAFEDWLKNVYFEILKIIETWCNDEIVFSRSKALEYVFELLRDKPEQEANLLRLLINKLGDTDKKIASKTSYTITQLQTSHPLMKSTIISSIESELIFRPGQSLYAKYYAVITLNQTVLSSKEEAVAQKLLDIYFSLFVMLLAKKEPKTVASAPAIIATLNKKGERQGGGGAPGKKAQKKLEAESKSLTVEVELGEKLLSAVLTGVNRAIPYAKMSDETFNKHIDTLFKVTHSSNFNTGIRALMLIQQLCGSHQTASDRFYRALYESLLDPRLMTSSKQAMYLNLLYRALRADLSVQRVEAFAKRLLQVVAMHQPPFACAVLYLLRELEGVFPRLQSFVDQPEEESIDDEEEFHDVGDDRTIDQPARADAIQASERRKAEGYDGRKREPEYSNADRSCLWEIVDIFLALDCKSQLT
jgi:ribosome biogenesis protein MAK21